MILNFNFHYIFKLLMEDLHGLAGRIDDLRAVCPMQGCGVGKDGEVGALWRHWLSLLRDVGLLMVRIEQRGEEWKDITASVSLNLNKAFRTFKKKQINGKSKLN